MALACIHTHTNFCDGSDDIETCCRIAHNKGLSALGFSSHAPVTKKTGLRTHWNMPDERLDEYIETVLAAKKRWEGKLPIYLGLEVDFIPGLIGPADKDFRDMGLDFIIGGAHYVVPPKGEPFTIDDTPDAVLRGIRENFDGDHDAMVKAFFDCTEAMIRAGGFDVLAHPDVVKKNNLSANIFSEEADYYQKRTATLAELLAASGIVAEVNTGGLNRRKTISCYPSAAFLKLLHKYGVPMVINADAHKAEDLDGHYEQARQAMLNAGYTETVIFAGRKNDRAVWNPEKL